MNTTYETSELTSSKTNMAPTTTFAKSKKGVVVLVALCMLFFYTGRLSSSTSYDPNHHWHPRSPSGASLDASLLRGFQQDVVGDDGIGSCTVVEKILSLCYDQYQICLTDKACLKLLRTEISVKCNCDSDFSCYDDAVREFGITGNTAIDNFIGCARRNAGDDGYGVIKATCEVASGVFDAENDKTEGLIGYVNEFNTCYQNGDNWEYCWTKSYAATRVLTRYFQCVPDGYTGNDHKGWHHLDPKYVTPKGTCGGPCQQQHHA